LRGFAGAGPRALSIRADDLLRRPVVLDDLEHVPRLRDIVKTDDLDRSRRPRRAGSAPQVVHQRPHLAGLGAGDEEVAHPQRAVLHQHGRHGSAPLVESRLDDCAQRGLRGVGGQFQHVGLQQDHLQQRVEPDLRLGRHLREDGRAAPRFRDEAVLGELTLDALRLRLRLVDLVDRDQDRRRPPWRG
jgi:hypothetical protein